MDHQLVIKFVDCSSADANTYAQDLEGVIIGSDRSVKVTRGVKPGSQEIVSSLVLLFGTPVAGVLAHAVHRFLIRNSGARIMITTPDETVLGDHLDSKDAARIAEAFSAAKKAK